MLRRLLTFTLPGVVALACAAPANAIVTVSLTNTGGAGGHDQLDVLSDGNFGNHALQISTDATGATVQTIFGDVGGLAAGAGCTASGSPTNTVTCPWAAGWPRCATSGSTWAPARAQTTG